MLIIKRKKNSHVPEDLQYLFQGKLSDNGTTKLSHIKTVIDSLPHYDLEENLLIKQRIEHMLEFADFDVSKCLQIPSLLVNRCLRNAMVFILNFYEKLFQYRDVQL